MRRWMATSSSTIWRASGDFYATLSADAALAPFCSLLLIEQPLHRSKALNEAVGDSLGMIYS